MEGLGQVLNTLQTLDGSVLLWIQNNLRQEQLTLALLAITRLGNTGTVWIVLGLLFLCLKKTRKMGATMLLALMFSLLLNNCILKDLFARTRPYEVIDGLILLTEKATDYSFPSGHAGSSFAAATVIFECMKENRQSRRRRWLAVFLAVLIAFSRLYIGIHYPSDVICGMLSGILCGRTALYLVRGQETGHLCENKKKHLSKSKRWRKRKKENGSDKKEGRVTDEDERENRKN